MLFKKTDKNKQRGSLVLGRRKILMVASLIIFALLGASTYGIATRSKEKRPVEVSNSSQYTGGLSVSNQPSTGSIVVGNQPPRASEILKQINNVRAANNLPAVSENKLLNQSSISKLDDMIARNYWSLNAPDGTEPWVFIQQTGYKYRYAGENLWNGRSDTAMSDWLISPTHKAVMLDARYKEVGIAVQRASNYNGQQNVYIVVTHYASPYTGSASTYVPTTNTSASGSGYQYQLPDYSPTPMPDFDYSRSSTNYQPTTQQNCGTNTDSSYYANCMGQ